MGKSEIVKHWKVELRDVGFVYRNGMFECLETQEKHVQFVIAIQRKTRGATYKISPTIVMRNPLLDPSKLEVLLSATLHPDGIYLHQKSSSWWDEPSAPEALAALKERAVPWFERVGSVDYLIKVLETAIENRTRPINVIEPMDQAADPEWVKEWLPEKPFEQRRVGTVFFYQAAVLHYINGDRVKAIERTKDWLNSLGSITSADRLNAAAQLVALEMPAN